MWTIDFVFTIVEPIKIKNTFCQEFHRNHPYLNMSKKYFFLLISYDFPISMKKLKNRLFVKKRKNYLKCEFQKTCTFEVTCWKMIHIFWTKVGAKVRNTIHTKFFWNIKISWKIMNFVYQNLHSTKKVHEKNDFSQITHMWSDIDFMDFWKKSIFFNIFLFKFTL